MCLYPKQLKNKGYHQNGGLPVNTIPCGKCSECREVKKIDYTLRTIATYQANPFYDVWFSTLTFSPKYLPKACLYKREQGKWTSLKTDVPTFNHDLLHTFTKSLKQWFRRHGYTFHYLITCEYGDSRHRPHYHAIFFIPKIFHSWESFRDFLLRFWSYGFVKNTRIKEVDGVVSFRDFYNSVKYVCKYATKGASWLPDYVKYPHHYSLDGKPSQYMPRVFTSNNYGAALENLLTDDDYINNKVTISTGSKFQNFNIPRYYHRKHFIKYQNVSQHTEQKIIYHPGTPSFPRLHYHDYKHMENVAIFRHNYDDIRLLRIHQKCVSDYKKLLDYTKHTEFTPPSIFWNAVDVISADLYASMKCSLLYKFKDPLRSYSCDYTPAELDAFGIIDSTLLDFSIFDSSRKQSLAKIKENKEKEWYKRHIFTKRFARYKKKL